MVTYGYNNDFKIDVKSLLLQTALGGNVGINTTSPSQKLELDNGSALINRANTTTFNGYILGIGGSAKWNLMLRTNDNNFYLYDEVLCKGTNNSITK